MKMNIMRGTKTMKRKNEEFIEGLINFDWELIGWGKTNYDSKQPQRLNRLK